MNQIFLILQKRYMKIMSNKLKKLQNEYAYVIQHPDMVERAIELKADIDYLKRKQKSY